MGSSRRSLPGNQYLDLDLDLDLDHELVIISLALDSSWDRRLRDPFGTQGQGKLTAHEPQPQPQPQL